MLLFILRTWIKPAATIKIPHSRHICLWFAPPMSLHNAFTLRGVLGEKGWGTIYTAHRGPLQAAKYELQVIHFCDWLDRKCWPHTSYYKWPIMKGGWLIWTPLLKTKNCFGSKLCLSTSDNTAQAFTVVINKQDKEKWATEEKKLTHVRETPAETPRLSSTLSLCRPALRQSHSAHGSNCPVLWLNLDGQSYRNSPSV